MNYQEAIRIAEERERHLKKAFEEYDDDNSGTIDSDEILVLMEAIGLLKNLKSNRIEFITEMFMKYDENNDGVLSFEEFKGVHNAAVDAWTAKAIEPCVLSNAHITTADLLLLELGSQGWHPGQAAASERTSSAGAPVGVPYPTSGKAHRSCARKNKHGSFSDLGRLKAFHPARHLKVPSFLWKRSGTSRSSSCPAGRRPPTSCDKVSSLR